MSLQLISMLSVEQRNNICLFAIFLFNKKLDILSSSGFILRLFNIFFIQNLYKHLEKINGIYNLFFNLYIK